MSGYQIGPVHYIDFGPFISEVFDFSVPGLTCIEAVVEGVPGCDSNGAGKSFLFDGVAWCLYGRCIRKDYTGDDIIRGKWDPKRKRNIPAPGTWACVTTHIVGGPKPVRVERYRKHPDHDNKVFLFVDEHPVSRGTNAETERAIEELIGMDFATFCNVIAFGVREDIKSFYAASDADRKGVMDNLLGLSLYGVAEQVARRRMRKLGVELDDLSAERVRLQTALSEKTVLYQNLAGKDLEDADFQIRLKTLLVKLHRRAHTKSKQDVSDLNAEQRVEEDRYKKVLEEHARAVRVYEVESAKREREKRELDRTISTLEGEIRQIEARVERLSSLKGKKCPTCEQDVNAKTANNARTILVNEIGDINYKITATELERDIVNKGLETLEDPEQPESSELGTLQQEIEQARETRNEWKLKLETESARLEEMEGAQGRIKAQADRLSDEMEKVGAKLIASEERYAALSAESEDLEFWIEGYGAQGLRSFLIEAELPEINRWATVFAQRLLGKGTRVKLSPTTKLKSKDVRREKIHIECLLPRRTNKYEGASRGQKTRLDLCLLLSFRHTIAERSAKAFRQFFADELFDGMDKTGAVFVADLLLEIAQACPVTLVTHDPRIKSIADRVITVYHDGEYAVLKGPATVKKDVKQAVKRRPA